MVLFKKKRIYIESNNLHWFKPLKHPRELGEKHVKKLAGELLRDGTYREPITLNDVSTETATRYRIVNGFHRWNGLLFNVEKDPSFNCALDFNVYDHLSEAEELKLFDMLNTIIRKNQLRDTLNVHQDYIPLYKMIQDSFPIPLRAYRLGEGQTGLQLSTLMRIYLGRASDKRHHVGTETAMQMVEKLGEEDYEFLCGWAKAVNEVFQPLVRDNFWAKMTSLDPLMKVWYANKDYLGEEEVITLWKRRVLMNKVIRNLVIEGGLTAIEGITREMVHEMNRGRSKKLVLLPSEWNALNDGLEKPGNSLSELVK